MPRKQLRSKNLKKKYKQTNDKLNPAQKLKFEPDFFALFEIKLFLLVYVFLD